MILRERGSRPTFSVVNIMPSSPCWMLGSIKSSIMLTSAPRFLILESRAATQHVQSQFRTATHHLCVCVSECCGTPCSDHHIEEEREQVIHAPHEVALQLKFDFQSQLLEGLMDDDKLVRWRERGAAHRWIHTLPLYAHFHIFFFSSPRLQWSSLTGLIIHKTLEISRK